MTNAFTSAANTKGALIHTANQLGSSGEDSTVRARVSLIGIKQGGYRLSMKLQH